MLSCLLAELAYAVRRVLLSCVVVAQLVACDSGLAASDAAPGEERDEAGAAPSRDADAVREPAEVGKPARAGDAGGTLAEGVRADAATASPLDAASADAAPLSSDAEAPRPGERSRDFAVGTRRIEIATDGGRVLPVQLWYPALDQAAAEADAGHGIEEFEAPGPRRELLQGLIPDARKACPTLIMHAALDAAPYPRSAPFPLLVYSHHFNGSRFSMFSIAEGLAREGMVVAAPDHVGGSLFERQGGANDALSQFNNEFLQTRAADLRRVLDVLLTPSSALVPIALRGRFDPARVGALGHSLGGFTVGVFSVNDTRVRASAYLAMIPSPALAMLLLDLPKVEQLRTPALYLTAHEDSVVQTLGGEQELSANFNGQPPAAYGASAAALSEALAPELVSVKQHAGRTSQGDAGSP
jgi:predicted dienelactone hydrolase